MPPEKRSQITPDRLAELQQRDAVYEVKCGIQGCPCGRAENKCGRGFFSLFIQAVYGMDFARRVNIPYYINFGNCKYPYTDSERHGEGNFWNYYFKQNEDLTEPYRILIPNKFIELYPLKIWSRSFFRSINSNVIQHIEFQDHLQPILQNIDLKFKDQFVLGVHIRGTDHLNEVPPVSIDNYLKEINKRIHKIDKLFLATDESRIVDLFLKKYRNKLIYHDAIRSENNEALHANSSLTGYKLGYDALLDCYSLSRCNEVILTHSNLSYASLLFNPHLKYKLMERPKSRIKKLKTLLLYNLNEWRIRKW